MGGAERLFVGRAHSAVCTMGILHQQGITAGIFTLSTAEHHQGKGYGHHMMRVLMKTAMDRGGQKIILSPSSEAGLRLYPRINFQKVGFFDCFEYQPSSR
ncbi:MAG: GNAT family N-acetyltransferase [Alphaproteobacteria bacterium]|nr:GNAT family N-acetyltransferase [Alphaproteobacteria bacterium]